MDFNCGRAHQTTRESVCDVSIGAFRCDSTHESWLSASNVTDVKNLPYIEQNWHTISTDIGISNVYKSLYANANSSIHCNFEFHSNVIDISDLYLKKQNLHTTSTNAGIWIVSKSLSTNAFFSIYSNFEFDSNVTDVRNQQLKSMMYTQLHLIQKCEMFSNNSLQMHIPQFVAISSSIQMSQIQMICISKSRMCTHLQLMHELELSSNQSI
jgi:hypothetical protein